MNECFLYCAGEYYDGYISPDDRDIVVAVDGGYKLIDKLALSANAVVGDFDSLGFVPNAENVTKLPCIKDQTDTEYACLYYLDKGIERFYLFGACGGRADHTIANIQVLNNISRRGGQGFIFAKDAVYTSITDSTIIFDKAYTGYISCFSQSGTARGVCESGLKYSLDNATLDVFTPIGVSNEFTGNNAVISVESGTLLIMFERHEPLPLPLIKRRT